MMKFRILLISDDLATAKMVQNIIRHHRLLKVEETTTLEDGIACIQSSDPFHAILCDLTGRGASSIHLLGLARSRSPDTRVIVMTGFGDHQLMIDAIKAGAYGYLHKPFRPEELNLVLNNLTTHFQQVEKLAQADQDLEKLQKEIEDCALRVIELETMLANLRAELKKHEPDKERDFHSAIEKAAQERTGVPLTYNVSRELTHLTHLLEERKINLEEYGEFRRNILEKAYQTPLV